MALQDTTLQALEMELRAGDKRNLEMMVKYGLAIALFLLHCSGLIAAEIAKAAGRSSEVNGALRSKTQESTSYLSENIPAYELQALHALYNSTNGADWIWNATLGSKWLFTDTANPCAEAWEGVYCTPNASALHVTGLNLGAMNLVGTLPGSIGDLASLQKLYLQANNISGEIPESIGNNCTELINLILNNNNLNGTLPVSIGALHNLIILDLGNNHLHGHLPDCFGSMSQLQYFDVSYNRFTGALPESLGNCTELIELVLDTNALYGTLPESYSRLTKLGFLDLFSNFLYGTIPAFYGNLTALVYFHLYDNKLTGTIPDVFGGMQQLVYFYVGMNHLTGSIPESLSLALDVFSIDVSQNFLNGTVPAALGNLPLLEVIYGYDNSLSGTLPAELGNCPYMLYFIFSANQLTGTLPTSFSNWRYLQFMELDYNQISGPIPSEYSVIQSMYYFQLNFNALTGTIPIALSAFANTVFFAVADNALTGPLPGALIEGLPALFSLDVGNNGLTGTLPSAIGSLPYFEYLDLYGNYFTGTLPESYGALSDLQFFFCDENSLTGNIPNSYGGMAFVEQFYAYENLLSGTIPESLGNIRFMQFLSLHNNMLTGTIPASFANTAYLLALLIDSNHLSGTIENVFDASVQVVLVTIVLNDNKLSGTLPDELFRLPSLNSFGGVSNCFHGELPTTLCTASTLVTLALDGLSSGASCRDTLLPGISSSYVVHSSLHGSIPACVFSLPLLTTLHLSGNGLSGSLPDAPITPFLLDLSLSHNILTGTIPVHIQERNWYNLDLSYNRLEGSLVGAFESVTQNGTFFAHLSELIGINVTERGKQSSLSLETNRLSGILPQVILSRQNVSVLGSNVFSCNIEDSNVPKHDKGRKNYQCGSASFNIPFYVWLSLVSTTTMSVLIVWRYHAVFERYVGVHYAMHHLHKWATVLESHRDIVSDDRVKSYRSVMELSAALCKIAAQCAVYIVLVLAPLYAGMSTSYGTLLHQYAWTVSAAYLTGWVPAILMLVCLLGLLVMLLAGFTQYLKVHHHSREVTHRDSSARSTALVMLIYAMFLGMNLVVVVGVNTAYVLIAIYGPNDVQLLSQLVMSGFKLFWNWFFSVYLIRWTAQLEALVRPITDASTAPRSAEAEFVTLQMAVALVNNIAIPCLVVAGISPSCFYNVFVVAPKITSIYTYETCAFVYGSTCLAFEPGEIGTSYNPPFTYNYQCSSSFITYYAPTFVLLCLMSAFASPVAQFALLQLHRRAAPRTRWFALLDYVLSRNLKPIIPGKPARVNVFSPFFDANQLLLLLFTYLGLLLTFGAVFPPVALALLVTLLAVLYLNKLKVGRFLCQALEQNQLDYVDAVEAESGRSGFLPVLERAVWMLVTVSCWFYTLFLFDTLGDAVGFAGAYWVLIVMPLMPVVLYVLWRAWKSVHASRVDQTVVKEKEKATEVELGEVGGTVNILRAGNA